MDLLLSLLTSISCGLISLVLVGAILNPKVHDGVVIKVGLICMAAGFGAMALRMWDGVGPEEVLGIERALLLINAGIALVILGYLMRKTMVKHPVRRLTDWAESKELT